MGLAVLRQKSKGKSWIVNQVIENRTFTESFTRLLPVGGERHEQGHFARHMPVLRDFDFQLGRVVCGRGNPAVQTGQNGELAGRSLNKF
jgi:hypothetical protein